MSEIQVPNFVDTLESFTDILHLSILLIEVRFRARIPKSANESTANYLPNFLYLYEIQELLYICMIDFYLCI